MTLDINASQENYVILIPLNSIR